MKYHHEKYDGSGYPDGKRGDEIAITSNIMIVADALDAMTSNRIYQKRKSIDEAISEIVKYKGIWYHPKIVDTLVSIYNKGYISTVETNQLPLTQMEEERFSYFFKDQLTSFYNDSYLWMILNNQIPTINSKYFLIIELKEMSQYNKIHNWHNGSILIKNIAQYISKRCEQKLIFRVFGDDFVLVFDDKEIFEDILNKWNEVKIGNVYTTLKSISRNELIDKMESFW
jgi:GGDEF domain-containing protein